MLSPILLFVYNRPQHTRRVVESLKANPLARQSTLIVYADGAKGLEDQPAVDAVRQYVRGIGGFAQLQVIEHPNNRGLASNIIEGVSTQIAIHKRVIVVEDDLIVSSQFLSFMNGALEMYKDEEKVGHIQACNFVDDDTLPDTFLIKWTGSWGWATWQRAWNHFNPNGSQLLQQLKEQKLTHEFDFNGAYPFTRMLENQIIGKNNSWAIRWNASLFLKDILSLNVGRTLVSNEGFDGTGTHCGTDDIYSSELRESPLVLKPIYPLEENKLARERIEKFYRQHYSFFAKVKRRLYNLLKG